MRFQKQLASKLQQAINNKKYVDLIVLILT